jgi:hypothetical protein
MPVARARAPAGRVGIRVATRRAVNSFHMARVHSRSWTPSTPRRSASQRRHTGTSDQGAPQSTGAVQLVLPGTRTGGAGRCRRAAWAAADPGLLVLVLDRPGGAAGCGQALPFPFSRRSVSSGGDDLVEADQDLAVAGGPRSQPAREPPGGPAGAGSDPAPPPGPGHPPQRSRPAGPKAAHSPLPAPAPAADLIS